MVEVVDERSGFFFGLFDHVIELLIPKYMFAAIG